jgi:hypothetical protein
MRWRLKIQKQYKNHDNGGLTYIGPMGEIALTPALVLDWARALVWSFAFLWIKFLMDV